MGRPRRARGIHSLSTVGEPRVSSTGRINPTHEADDRTREPEPEAERPRTRRAIVAMIVPVVVAGSLFVAFRSSTDSSSPTAQVAGASEPPSPTAADTPDRVLPEDATEIEVVHRTVPPDGGLYSVVVEIRNGSDIAIPISTLGIEVEAAGARIDPFDVRYDNTILAAGGSVEAALRVELPADSEPVIVVSFEGDIISRLALD